MIITTILTLFAITANQQYQWPKSLSTQFSQDSKSEITQKTITIQGSMDYQFPGQLRFEILSPKDQQSLFVSNKQQAWFYTPAFDEREKGEVSKKDPSTLPFTEFFDLLIQYGDKKNDHYTLVTKGNQMIMDMKPIWEKKIQVKRAILTFADPSNTMEKLKSLSLTQSDDKIIVLIFSGMKTNIEHKKDYFIFKQP